MRTSYSALDTFQKCPQKFKFQVIDKIKAPKTVETVFGSTVHTALKFMFSRDPLFPTLDEILMHFSASWNDASSNVHPKLTEEFAATYEDAGKSIIKNFYKRNPPWNLPVVDTESRFELLLPDPERERTHVLAGIIDRIDKIADGEYEIIDYKTNRKLPSQNAVDQNLQMSLYHMAILRRWPNLNPKSIKVSLYFLKHNEKISSFRNLETLQETAQSVLKTIHDIEGRMSKNDFLPNPSALCDYCHYRQICPAWKHLYQKNKTPPPDEQQLQEALHEYFSIKKEGQKNEARMKVLQEMIRAYMKTHELDRVFDERGYFISKKIQQRFTYNFEKIREILLAAGLEDKWNMILEADTKKLKLIMDELPQLVRAQILEQKLLSKEFVVLGASSKPIKKPKEY